MAAPQHEQSTASVIKSFVHRRQPSKGEALVPEPLSAEIQNIPDYAAMGVGRFAKNDPGALGELQKNQQEAAPRAQRAPRDDYGENVRGRPRSPTKSALNPFKPSSKMSTKTEARSASPTKKPKKVKSGTNLAGLLSRPKSFKNLYKSAAEDEAKLEKNKENRTPDASLDLELPPPIFAQFTSDASVRDRTTERISVDVQRNASSQEFHSAARPAIKERPKSYQVSPSSRPPTRPTVTTESSSTDSRSYRSKAFNALTGRGHSRTKSAAASPVTPSTPSEPTMDPKDVDKHLEAMLDRRNIPENQRYKMRNLNNTIKMEFIRQDWAEMAAAKADRPGTTDSINSKEGDGAMAAGTDDEERPKKSRGRSFTSTFSRSKKDRSPSKKRDGTLGRHFKSKSSESVVSERPTSSSGPSTSNSFLSKIKLQQGPVDYVTYLRKVQKPEAVEVGKIHKLRLLLRNETVAWIEEFMQQGGMKEIVGLLHRIMEIEWREEHEDALLHEVLLCLKALSSTSRGMAFLHTVQATLFPKLLHMIFDPDRKGPSEFTTRGIITFVLFTYIESAAPNERVARAKNILSHLRDPRPDEAEQPLAFVMDMRQERPFRVWNKEVVSVTKEVFWIFLHNLNVVTLEKKTDAKANVEESYGYMHRHFPQERPPVPAAPYVGGVEWDATNYLASHLDLLNAIIACTPTREQRNALRSDLKISGWERLMGASLRLCKEKFYGSVHDGLRTWVGAAGEDGWEVRDVRYGPAPEVRKSPKKKGGEEEKAPMLDFPKMDLGVGVGKGDDGWMS